MPIDPIVSQAATLLNAAQAQATGTALAPITTPADFVSAAQTTIKNGYDPILNALSQMWSRTIFSIRDYAGKLRGLDMTGDRWGNITRKISPIDTAVENDQRFAYPVGYDSTQTVPSGDGLAVDMYKLHKPQVQQTAFYGQSVYEDVITIFRDNLDTAFRSADEFVRFNSMIMQNRANKLTQYEEDARRVLLANAIASLKEENKAGRIIHLITEYNTETGTSFTLPDLMKGENYAPFIRWTYARLATLARMFSNRSNLFQTVINSAVINRHTPADRLKVFVTSKHLDQINSMAKSITFHDDYLNSADWEGVDFWQAIGSPDSVKMTPTYTGTSGTIVSSSAQTVTNIFGLMFDEDFLGMARVNSWSGTTPFNVLGGYWNEAFHINHRSRFDMTEKAVLLLLD